MDIIGDRKFVEVPGGKTHELPPLLVKTVPGVTRLDKMMEIANNIIEQEDMIPPVAADSIASEDLVERRKMDLALNLIDQYLGLLTHWHWGDAVVEWIRQCEITFGARPELRTLLRSDIWPHAGRSSFVTLLEDKDVNTEGVQLEKAVGLRLAFRQMPPIRCCSDQFLFYLNNSVAQTAFRTWLNMTPSPISSFPPERFEFEVVNMSLDVH
ncbi:MAG TPA: hypothetical protein VFB14_08230 [Bryobacteraceae bacterium]|jgi:hypothetical protein|nr:hypothetical protein [Bryobacteraceae bacterium]